MNISSLLLHTAHTLSDNHWSVPVLFKAQIGLIKFLITLYICVPFRLLLNLIGHICYIIFIL